MSLYSPDIKKENPLCVITDQIFVMYTDDQILKFEIPVYYDSIRILPLGSDPDNDDSYLTKDIDYVINEINTTEIAKIKLVDDTWDEILVDSIILKNSSSNTTNMTMNYRQIMPDIILYNSYLGTNIEITPDWLIALQDQVMQLKYKMSTTYHKSQFTDESAYIQFVDMDLLGTSVDNKIVDEIHLINSISNNIVVSPNFGSYYSDTLTIVNDVTGIELVKGADYSFLGSNINKNRVSLSSDEIYDYIIIHKNMHEKVRITYQAFGGTPSLSNFKELYNQVNNINRYLSKNNFVSEASLENTDSLIDIRYKINTLENKMRNLVSEGTPTYADVTTGITSRFKILSPNNELNWYSIASLYKVEGSNSHIFSDVFDFHIEFMNNNIHLEGSVLVDMNYKTLQTNITNNTETDINTHDIHFRILWNDMIGYSGVILQIGFKLPGSLSDTFSVEDKSGKEGCWILHPSSDSTIGPSNTEVLLPDGINIWGEVIDNSNSVTLPVIMNTGTSIIDTTDVAVMNGPIITIPTKFSISDILMKSINNISVSLICNIMGQHFRFSVNVDPVYREQISNSLDTDILMGRGLLYDSSNNPIEVFISIRENTVTVNTVATTHDSDFTNLTIDDIKLY